MTSKKDEWLKLYFAPKPIRKIIMMSPGYFLANRSLFQINPLTKHFLAGVVPKRKS